jgi:hypothetical protein
MTDDLLPVLRERYPKLFSSEHLREIACYPGWLNLLDGLCHELQPYLVANPGVPQVVVRQVKEKFGGLRFYITGGDEFCRVAVLAAQEASLTVCEVCGQLGVLVGERCVSVRCNEHVGWTPSL